MKIRWKVIFLAGIAAVTLAGCGAPQKATSVGYSRPQNLAFSGSQSEPVNATQSNATQATMTTLSSPSSNDSSTQTAVVTETSASQQTYLNYDDEGASIKERATRYESKHQPFSLYVLDSYRASGEEPGADIITCNNVPSASMRISVLAKQAKLEELVAGIKENLKAVSSNVQQVKDPTFRNDKFFQNAVIYSASTNKMAKTIFLLYLNGSPVEIAISAPLEMESWSPFYAMVKTLQLN